MQSLTERVWSERFPYLRATVMDVWPEVPRQELEKAGGDYDALVALIQRSADVSADKVIERLRNIDVDAIRVEEDDEAEVEVPEVGPASVEQLRLGSGFAEDERPRILERMRKLDRRLKRFPADATDLELSVKERDTTSQKVTLECSLPGFPRFVTTSTEPDLRDALMDCREDLWRQIDDAVTTRGRG